MLFRRIVKNSSYLFSATGFSAGIGVLQGILVARLVSVDGFGVLAIIMTFTNVINNLASFRMHELVVKYVGEYNEQNEPERAAAVFKAAALLEILASLVAFCMIFLLAPLAAQFFAKDSSKTNLFILYGLIVLANLITESSTGLLQIQDRYRRIALLNLSQSIFTLLLTLAAFWVRPDLTGVVLAYLGGKSVSALSLAGSAWMEAARQWGRGWWRARLDLLRPQRGLLLRFAFSTNISATINLVNKDSELLWVSLLRGPVETGYYRLALSLVNFIEMPVAPLPQTTYPELARLASKKDWAGMRAVLRQGSLLAGAFSWIAAAFLVLLGQPLIQLYGDEFLPAYPALVILLLGSAVANTFYWRRVALLSLGQAGFPARLNSILALLKTAGILVFVPRFGYLASATLLSAFYWIGSLASVFKLRSLLRQREAISLQGAASNHPGEAE